MSIKAMALVWEFKCPQTVNGVAFNPPHKFVLLSYADHADHNGKNIYPAVATISKKCGYVDRSVQRITSDLEAAGLLIPEGKGPRGTNKWALPYSQGGDKLSPLTKLRGDNGADSLGDIPSGDIPSGDILSPELKEPEPKDKEIKEKLIKILRAPAMSILDFRIWNKWRKQLESDSVVLSGDENKIVIHVAGMWDKQFSLAEYWEDLYTRPFKNLGMELEFVEVKND